MYFYGFYGYLYRSVYMTGMHSGKRLVTAFCKWCEAGILHVEGRYGGVLLSPTAPTFTIPCQVLATCELREEHRYPRLHVKLVMNPLGNQHAAAASDEAESSDDDA